MLKDVYNRCRKMLGDGGIEAPDLEAQCIVEHVTGCGRAALIARGSDEIDKEKEREILSLAKRRLDRCPLQYLIGSWSFCGFALAVGEGVLIPRDDTEVAVRLCLDYLKGKKRARILDLCAGSGAISIALAKLADAEVDAVELSDKAFYFLEKNIQSNHAEVRTMKGDIFECHKKFDDRFYDLIVSNPPYIRSREITTLQAEVQLEPRMALDGGESGLDFYEAITTLWSSKLKPGGAMVFELGEGQEDAVSQLLKAEGFEHIRTSLDFGGEQRAIIGTMQQD